MMHFRMIYTKRLQWVRCCSRCMYLSNSDDVHRHVRLAYLDVAVCTFQTRMMYTLQIGVAPIAEAACTFQTRMIYTLGGTINAT